MACQWNGARCLDPECPYRDGGGPCDGATYEPLIPSADEPPAALARAGADQRRTRLLGLSASAAGARRITIK